VLCAFWCGICLDDDRAAKARSLPDFKFSGRRASHACTYHVCGADASVAQMKVIIDGYDQAKRLDIARGTPNARAATGNPVFPPEFSVSKWAYRGADEGEVDRRRCNPNKSSPAIPNPNDFDLPF
jgi:hypothetical protein